MGVIIVFVVWNLYKHKKTNDLCERQRPYKLLQTNGSFVKTNNDNEYKLQIDAPNGEPQEMISNNQAIIISGKAKSQTLIALECDETRASEIISVNDSKFTVVIYRSNEVLDKIQHLLKKRNVTDKIQISDSVNIFEPLTCRIYTRDKDIPSVDKYTLTNLKSYTTYTLEPKEMKIEESVVDEESFKSVLFNTYMDDNSIDLQDSSITLNFKDVINNPFWHPMVVDYETDYYSINKSSALRVFSSNPFNGSVELSLVDKSNQRIKSKSLTLDKNIVSDIIDLEVHPNIELTDVKWRLRFETNFRYYPVFVGIKTVKRPIKTIK